MCNSSAGRFGWLIDPPPPRAATPLARGSKLNKKEIVEGVTILEAWLDFSTVVVERWMLRVWSRSQQSYPYDWHHHHHISWYRLVKRMGAQEVVQGTCSRPQSRCNWDTCPDRQDSRTMASSSPSCTWKGLDTMIRGRCSTQTSSFRWEVSCLDQRCKFQESSQYIGAHWFFKYHFQVSLCRWRHMLRSSVSSRFPRCVYVSTHWPC